MTAIDQKRKHAVITGTGRSGTTMLVELMTKLGLDTGFTEEDIVAKKDGVARAGLEFDIRNDDCPYIVKSPHFCHWAEDVFDNHQHIEIDHIFVPMRDVDAAAESRRHVTRDSVSQLPLLKRLRHKIKPRRKFSGALMYTRSNKRGAQEEVLLRHLYELMLAASDTRIPVTLMRYPRIVKDSQYLYDKLQPVLNGMSFEAFDEVFKATVRPDLVHSFNEKDK